MLFEILSRENCQPTVVPTSTGEPLFQKSANPANALVTVLLFVIYLFPKFLGFKGGQTILDMSGMRNRVRQNCQVQSHVHFKRAVQHGNSQVSKTT